MIIHDVDDHLPWRKTSAITIDRVMTQATHELYLDGTAVSPRDRLLAGNPPAAVIEMVAQLYAW